MRNKRDSWVLVQLEQVLVASAGSMVRILVQDPVFVSRTKEHALAGVFAMAIVFKCIQVNVSPPN
jgi:hypothetical protein